VDEMDRARTFASTCKACGSSLSLASQGICEYCGANNITQAFAEGEIKSLQENIKNIKEDVINTTEASTMEITKQNSL